MTTTESETETVKPLIDEATLDRLMAQVEAEGLELLGPDGVLTELTSRIMNRAMEAELTDHLGYEHGDPVGHGSGNNRNGTSVKTVLTDAGAVPLKVPRGRNGEFEPKLVPKHARRLEGFNDIVLSLVSRGMTTRDVRAHLAAAYQVDISAELISKITDVVLPELRAWQARPLDAMYPVLYLDAIVVKVRTDGRVTNRPVYIAMAIDLDGCKHVLGLWLGNGDEGAKFWLGVLTELRNRGVLDPVLLLEGPARRGQGAQADLHRRHRRCRRPGPRRVRNRLWGDRRAVALTLGPVHPVPRFRPAIRKSIHTTNAIESLNYQLRKVTKTRGSFPTDDAVLKIFYLAIDNIGHHRGGELGSHTQGWKQVLNAFAIAYPGRIPETLS